MEGDDLRAELRHVCGRQVGVRGPGEMEAVRRIAILARVHDRNRRGRRAAEDVAVVDAALHEETGEELTELIVRQASEKSGRDTEPAERDRRVERPSARQWMERPVPLDEIDQRLAGDGDHDARALAPHDSRTTKSAGRTTFLVRSSRRPSIRSKSSCVPSVPNVSAGCSITVRNG